MLRFDPLSQHSDLLLRPISAINKSNIYMHPILQRTAMTMEEEEEANWLDLPDHVTLQIVGKLPPSIFDCVRFSAVCVSWQSLFNSDDDFPKLHPLLIVPYDPTTIEKTIIDNLVNNNKKKAPKYYTCSFYSISDKRFYDQFQIRIPLGRYCRGSSKGWLVIVDDVDSNNKRINRFSLQLLNPFTHKEISLPAFPCNDTIQDYSKYLHKAVLSADPISNPKGGYLVMAIYGAKLKLAFFKSGGDKVWTPIKYENEWQVDMIDDVIYYKGKIHALDSVGKVMVCDETNGKVIKIMGAPSTTNDDHELITWKRYLVESSGDCLLQVHRYGVPMDDNKLYKTERFKVFKLLPVPAADHDHDQEGESEWVEVKNLDGRALFLGNNASISISASGIFPRYKPNSIYFTNAHFFRLKYGPQKIGVYDLKSETYEIHYPTDIEIPISPAPIWIEKTMIYNCDHM